MGLPCAGRDIQQEWLSLIMQNQIVIYCPYTADKDYLKPRAYFNGIPER